MATPPVTATLPLNIQYDFSSWLISWMAILQQCTFYLLPLPMIGVCEGLPLHHLDTISLKSGILVYLNDILFI